ncbi:hypothetical protein OSTOST_12626 [Ostertagia ostertagi]
MNSTILILAIIGAVLSADFGMLGQVAMDSPGDMDGPDDIDGPDDQGGPGGRGGPGRGRFGPGGRWDHRRHHRGPPPPPYLKNVSEEARREYFDIVKDMNKTIAQQKEDILEWAAKYEIRDQVEEFNANMTRIKTEVKQNVTNLINSMLSEFQQVSAIMDNEDQTWIEMFRALGNSECSESEGLDVDVGHMDPVEKTLWEEKVVVEDLVALAVKGEMRGGFGGMMDGQQGQGGFGRNQGGRGGFGGNQMMGGQGGRGGMMGGQRDQGGFGGQPGGWNNAGDFEQNQIDDGF